ncbi:hypothetical protein K7432_014498 [Basidiobolus ranarum]|uniref:Carrier domain-containing protein n=1 Tax=Basidiobolus ranarum TaxID=34480 RepID=A0ABR2VPE9_9FUNG
MLPSAFVRIDALPLTPNGKPDRQALPPPEGAANVHHAYEAPQGKIETMLTEIWSELLGLKCVSRHDNFFELGGHSLLAVRMISRIHAELGIDLALKILFESPSIVRLASQIERKGDIHGDSFNVLLPIQPKGNRSPLFCIHPAVGLSWSYFGLSKHLGPEQPIYGLQARGHNGKAPFAENIEDMASDYLSQIRSIQLKGPYYLLGWSFGGIVAHSIAILLQQQNEKVALLALIDSTLAYFHQRNQLNMNQLSTYVQLPRYSVNDYSDSGEELWEKVRGVVENNLKMAKKHSLMIYYGNVLFFRVTVPEEDQLLITPDMLKPYIVGAIDTRHIYCKHSDMDKPGPIAEIGHTLAKKLKQETFTYLKSRY